MRHLSKSKIIAFRQCPKRLWLEIHQPELRDDSGAETAFQIGNEVGEIARQVFSPVRYMQMVGRGLRGVKNGGTEKCRIVTVLDNLGRFQDRHPYHYCRQYFESYEA